MRNKRSGIPLIILVIALLLTIIVSINVGSIKVSYNEMFSGIFVAYDERVASIIDLRFPRIVISIFAGACFAVSGVLLQSLLKNPLADPTMIGISSGASLMKVIVTLFIPALYFQIPIFAFLGGVIVCAILYLLTYKGGMQPLKVILIGVAIQAILSAAIDLLAGSQSTISSLISSNVSLKTWKDVEMAVGYGSIGLVLSLFCCKTCDLMALEEKTIQSLGLSINKMRLLLMSVAVLLASIATAIVGPMVFLGLLAPHIGRLIVGSKHSKLIPFSMLLGAFILLLADTVGRSIMPPYEISASILFALIGGPLFIVLLKRSDKVYAK